MNSFAQNTQLITSCRQALERFWNQTLTVEEKRDGVVMALPLMLPDGLQVVLSLKPISSAVAILSDRGETLGKLASSGLNLESALVSAFVTDKCALFEMDRDGWELRKAIRLPVEGVDIQLFGEALVSLAHLIYRHEPEPSEDDVANRMVQRLFKEQAIEFRRNVYLEGQLEKRIKVDYYLDDGEGLALEVVGRRNQLLPYMEQWGWRWMDLHKRNPKIIRAMVYDPEKQPWDQTALDIGRSVCEVFCPYFETDILNKALNKVRH